MPRPHAEDIMRARDGDSEAFAKLLREFRPQLSRLCRIYFAPGGTGEDVRQEASLGLFKAVRDYNAQLGDFKAFAVLCMRRQLITYVKVSTRNKHHALNGAISLNAPRYSDAEEPWENYVATTDKGGDATESFKELARQCSKVENVVLTLYARGFSRKEIAQLSGRDEKSIGNALWRIRVKARRLRRGPGTTPR